MRNLVENCQFDPKWLFGQNRPIWSKMTNLVKNCNLVKNYHFQKVTFGQKGSNGGHERSNHLQILVLSRCCTWKRKHPLEVASEIRLIHKCRIQILFWDVIIIHWSISFSQSAHSTVHHTGRAQAQASPERFINLKVIRGHMRSFHSPKLQLEGLRYLLGTVWNWWFTKFMVTWLISSADKGRGSAIITGKIRWSSFYQICDDWGFRKRCKNFIIWWRYQIVLLKWLIRICLTHMVDS